MEDIFDSEITPKKKAEIIKQCDEYLAAIDRIFAQMAKDREEIDRLSAHTEMMLAQMRKAA